jgi:hypothetical protein
VSCGEWQGSCTAMLWLDSWQKSSQAKSMHGQGPTELHHRIPQNIRLVITVHPQGQVSIDLVGSRVAVSGEHCLQRSARG